GEHELLPVVEDLRPVGVAEVPEQGERPGAVLGAAQPGRDHGRTGAPPRSTAGLPDLVEDGGDIGAPEAQPDGGEGRGPCAGQRRTCQVAQDGIERAGVRRRDPLGGTADGGSGVPGDPSGRATGGGGREPPEELPGALVHEGSSGRGGPAATPMSTRARQRCSWSVRAYVSVMWDPWR